jgi:hypothetical protein
MFGGVLIENVLFLGLRKFLKKKSISVVRIKKGFIFAPAKVIKC